MSRQVHRTRGNPCANPPQIPPRIKLFVRRPPVKPDHDRSGGLPVRMRQQRGDVAREPLRPGLRRERPGKLLESVDHRKLSAYTATFAPRSIAFGKLFPT